MLVRQGAVDAVRLLRHDVDPAALVAAREARTGAPAGHVVEHGDVLGDADGVGGRQHDAELTHLDALRLHGDVEIEQHRIVGDLEALDMEMVLGEAHGLVAEVVGQPALLGYLAQHLLVQVGARARHAGLDVRLAAERRQVEQRNLHNLPQCSSLHQQWRLLRARARCVAPSGKSSRLAPHPRHAGAASSPSSLRRVDSGSSSPRIQRPHPLHRGARVQAQGVEHAAA
jgi:hypothetical protein